MSAARIARIKSLIAVNEFVRRHFFQIRCIQNQDLREALTSPVLSILRGTIS